MKDPTHRLSQTSKGKHQRVSAGLLWQLHSQGWSKSFLDCTEEQCLGALRQLSKGQLMNQHLALLNHLQSGCKKCWNTITKCYLTSVIKCWNKILRNMQNKWLTVHVLKNFEVSSLRCTGSAQSTVVLLVCTSCWSLKFTLKTMLKVKHTRFSQH